MTTSHGSMVGRQLGQRRLGQQALQGSQTLLMLSCKRRTCRQRSACTLSCATCAHRTLFCMQTSLQTSLIVVVQPRRRQRTARFACPAHVAIAEEEVLLAQSRATNGTGLHLGAASPSMPWYCASNAAAYRVRVCNVHWLAGEDGSDGTNDDGVPLKLSPCIRPAQRQELHSDTRTRTRMHMRVFRSCAPSMIRAPARVIHQCRS